MNTSATPPPRRNTRPNSTRVPPPCSAPVRQPDSPVWLRSPPPATPIRRPATSYPPLPSSPAAPSRPGPPRHNAFGPETLLVRRRRNMVDEDLEPLLPRQIRRQEARIPRFDWDEDPAGDWHTDLRRLSIYALEEGRWQEKDTDRGLNFLTVLAEADPSVRRYTALWIPPDSSPGTFLFRVRTATGKQLCSRPFTLAEIPSVAP